MSGLLAGAVLLFTLLSANGGFHDALHHTGKAAANSCVLCLFAKGQVDQPQTAPVLAGFVPAGFILTLRAESTVLVDFSYLSSPSRAPPALAPFSLAVA